ncbi:hypothetical protein K493DRAFT_310536 [Basidiobolus meristosporus CBS 931.73]|uniref:Velvet domain-containing protein n=1 Tax=Basidiobolus meristosporus CBS 931.73 TaxID=1314790 RepID=A0A1Y1Z999_9FUNG|nr:hypothetical protein K493DRAFT_310536 [Basidiobolus meristosporus CBS 931.73]|eukprot:ORY06597.1 hypothetical protein K493DRAFT_310536 [Basidiobolus meristosporus CBS 931.73]
MSGFGDRRRSIDPPPIVRLRMFDDEGRPIHSTQDLSFFSAHVDLWSEDCQESRILVVHPSTIPSTTSLPRTTVITLNAPNYARNLLGSLTSSAYHLFNVEGEPGVYFVFPDLSVRTEGRFTLRFLFFNLAQNCFGGASLVQAQVFSDPFTVYLAKDFPGGCEPTDLTRCFIKQGIRIPTRRTLLKPSTPEPEI